MFKGLVCSASMDGSVLRWLPPEVGSGGGVSVDGFAAALLVSLRATSSLVSRVLFWLDGFLEAAAGACVFFWFA
jgi:hypothetical protein